MPVKNYYLVLGVTRKESPEGIRSAYRELAKRLHPDRVGDQGTAAFQELSEAYAVLSDPGQRQRHDVALEDAERRARPAPARKPVVEPLRPEPVSIFEQPEDIRPAFDEFLDRYGRNFTRRDVPKGERAESLTLEVTLSPLEAMLGCTVPVGVPVFRTCPECGGKGRQFLFPCMDCRASGLVEEMRTVRIEVPPHTRAGAIFEVALKDYGIRNLYLRLHISISDGI